MKRTGYTTFNLSEQAISDALIRAEQMLSSLEFGIESNKSTILRLNLEQTGLESILSISANAEKLRDMRTSCLGNSFVEEEIFDDRKLEETRLRLEMLEKSRFTLEKEIKRKSEAKEIVEDSMSKLRALSAWHSFPFDVMSNGDCVF